MTPPLELESFYPKPSTLWLLFSTGAVLAFFATLSVNWMVERAFA